ncbi:MAG: hypothetical protein JNK54_02705 [Elusimicrobia bacterium]|mgnify:CR=1 FL=1|jgi:hypothetical protein|nr:hypothetical protein [Elusimicrobiota bacterium]
MEKPLKRPYPQIQLARALMLVGFGILLTSFALARLDREPFDRWFYAFAWWSYILIVDGWVYRQRGESLLISYPGRFLFLSLWSVVFWSAFELLNFRLQNWHYVGLPTQTAVRWLGYFISYATVVPALLETADLLDTGFLRSVSVSPLMRSGRWVLGLIGTVCLVLPLLWPKLFFPLIWAAPLLLLEPLNELLGGQSLLSDWRSGTLRRFSLLLTAGFFCGLLWEFWNAFAGAHWVYSVPGLDRWKIFEMPVVGYLGFLPFAVSAYTASVTATKLWEKSTGPIRAALGLASVGMCWVVFAGVDRLTLLLP